MCGIIGILSEAPAAPVILEGLRRLEYRGYDSAGIATLVNGSIDRRRAQGKLDSLAERLTQEPLVGTVGIGHTRWATHGRPTETNAHPHANDRVAVVHNGIIENFQVLRRELETNGHRFETETDTEVIVHLVTDYLDQQMTPQEAVARCLRRLEGAFALAIIFAGRHDLMVGARLGSPLAIGYGQGEMFLGSDALALAPLTDRIAYLEEGDRVEMTVDGAVVRDAEDTIVERPIKETGLSGAIIGKGAYRHFMEKEIFEQPGVIGDTLQSLFSPMAGEVTLPPMDLDLGALSRITISACGTAFYAGMVAKYWLEHYARQPVELDIASEFRYREAPMPDSGLSLFVSQSGETIDTLAALRYARAQGQPIVSVVNVPESAIARESDVVLRTLAGPEIGVASTKAFTTQLTVLACLTVAVGRARGTIDCDQQLALLSALNEVPARIAEILKHDDSIRTIARDLCEARDILFLGRGLTYPLALEGALKLKEISYIHAEGYAAGEMKHGPIALIDDSVPVIVFAPSGPLFQKTVSNVQEAIARGAKVVFVSDPEGIAAFGDQGAHSIAIPHSHPFVAPILYALPAQLLAYHTAAIKGTDVDQPRNLAKSVTVE